MKTWRQMKTYVNWGSSNQKSLLWICHTYKKEFYDCIVWYRKNLWMCSTQLSVTHWSGFWCAVVRNSLLFEINTRNVIIFKNYLWGFQVIILWENFTTISTTVSGKWRSTSRVVSDEVLSDSIFKREGNLGLKKINHKGMNSS